MADIGYLGTTQPADIARFGLQNVPTIDHDRPTGEFHTTPPIGHGRKANGGFSCTGFSDQAEHLACFNIKIDTMHDFNVMWFFARWVNGRSDFEAADL